MSRAVFCQLSAVIIFSSNVAFAQSVPQDSERGFTSYVSFQSSASSQGRIMKLDPSLGYNFNSHFGMSFGLPVYFIHTDATAVSPASDSKGLGNAYTSLNLTYLNPAVNFSSRLAGYVPTGDRDIGLSTGRFTFDWNNHLDRSFSRVTPFIDVGIGNTILDSPFFNRPFTTLGLATHSVGGINFNVWRFVSIGASGYAIVPRGDQKVYSKLVKQGGAPAGPGGHGRVFETGSVTSGTSDIARDDGFSSWIDASPSRTLDFSLGYTRSIHYQLDIVSFAVGVNVGKLFKDARSH